MCISLPTSFNNNNNNSNDSKNNNNGNNNNNIKFLGIIIDKHLTFKNQVDMIAQKISKSVGILFKLSKYLRLYINTKNTLLCEFIITLSHQSIFAIRNGMACMLT